MSYKTELQELESELAEIKEKKSRTQRKFFEAIGGRIRNDFPFHNIHKTVFGCIVFSFSTNGKFKSSKTTTYNNYFLNDIDIRLYYEKGQGEKVEKATKSIKELYKGEDDDKGLCHRANHRGDQAQGGKLDGLRQGVCDAFGGREKEQKANANMLGNNRLVARDRKDNKGAIGGNNAMDASYSVDIRGGNGGVFGLSLASSGARRDQEQTQINQNKRTNNERD